MKKILLALTGAAALTTAMLSPALACDGESHGKSECPCGSPSKQAAMEKAAKATKVSLEGKVVTFGCPMEAAQKACTGAALVVGETKHMIKKAGKGAELVNKARDKDKLVKVTGTKTGEFLTVQSFSVKG